MEKKATANKLEAMSEGVMAARSEDYTLNVTVLYENAAGREWAGQVCDQITEVAGAKAIRNTWWSLNDLTVPAVLAGSVSKAMRADMIVLAIDNAEGLPLPFYFWVNSWLPHRMLASGALIALLNNSDRPGAHSGRARKYLAALAKKSRMDLMIQERPHAAALKVLPSPLLAAA